MSLTSPKTDLQNGFTLLEVLISLVILSIGLLGLAALQTTSLKQNQGAYYRSQSAQLSYFITDRMRANISGLSGYVTTDASEASSVSSCSTSAGCSPANMAENDLYEWFLALNGALPSPNATISLNGSVYSISITWDDNRDNDSANDPQFITTFSP
jgi:type IV pilus assembly protein PilV